MNDDSLANTTIFNHVRAAFDAQGCWREHALILDLKRSNTYPFPSFDLSNTLALFKAHFLIRNAVYTLRRQLRSEQSADLIIGPIEIEKTEYQAPSDSQAVVRQDLLEAYYLDVDNYDEMTQAEVNLLLKGFWQKLHNPNQSEEALNALGLSAGASYKEIKAAFRKAAQQTHPDKGGDELAFKTLVEAKETLLKASPLKA